VASALALRWYQHQVWHMKKQWRSMEAQQQQLRRYRLQLEVVTLPAVPTALRTLTPAELQLAMHRLVPRVLALMELLLRVPAQGMAALQQSQRQQLR